MLGLQQTSLGMNPGNFGLGNANGLLGGQPGIGAVDPAQAMMSQMTEQMSQLMQALLGMLSQNQGAASGSGGFGGANGGASGVSDFLGGSGVSGSSATGASSGASDVASGTTGDSGSKAVDIAKKYLGQKSGGINDLKGFERTGQANNNCAEFVSACLDNAGVYKKKPGDASVRILKQHLIEDGWKKVSKDQAKPGDVAIFNGSQHVELVAEKGAKQMIGSNNKGSSTQVVRQGAADWGSKEYYSKG